jgi:hypothetical protein
MSLAGDGLVEILRLRLEYIWAQGPSKRKAIREGIQELVEGLMRPEKLSLG